MVKKSQDKKRVLIIDDDESILDAVSLILEENDYKTASTLKGEDTYKKIKTFNPDAILLDVLMSGKDGREICKKIKSIQESKNIPIIMISAHPSAGESTKEFGADAFLAKPFQVEDLLKIIKKSLKD